MTLSPKRAYNNHGNIIPIKRKENLIIEINDDLKDSSEIVSYLKETKEIKLCIQEVKEFETYDYVFIK